MKELIIKECNILPRKKHKTSFIVQEPYPTDDCVNYSDVTCKTINLFSNDPFQGINYEHKESFSQQMTQVQLIIKSDFTFEKYQQNNNSDGEISCFLMRKHLTTNQLTFLPIEIYKTHFIKTFLQENSFLKPTSFYRSFQHC